MTDKLNEQKEITKLEKKLGEEAAKFRSKGKAELEFELLQLAKHCEDIQTRRQTDKELELAKEHVASLNAPYKEQLAKAKIRHRFIALLLEELPKKGE